MADKKTCCFGTHLREGTIIILLLTLFSTIVNFFKYGLFDKSKKVRNVYTVESIIDLIFIIIGMIGVFGRKVLYIKVHAYFRLVALIFHVIVTLTLILPSGNKKSIISIIIYLIVTVGYKGYFIYAFFLYANQLKQEKEEEKELADSAAKV